MASAGEPRRVLILVENLPAPFDRRVWQEAGTLAAAGYLVSIVCPTGKGCEARRETIDGIDIHRYRLPLEAAGAAGYALEYALALWHSFRLACKVLRGRGFDAIHACNPPDLLFLVGGFFKLTMGKKFLFDQHDINPELYQAKFGRRGALHRLLLLAERCSYRAADVVIATNESYRRIATGRGGVAPERVHVVRSGPQLDRLRLLPPVPELRRGRAHLVGYVGVMGTQEGIDLLLLAARHVVLDLGRDVQFGLVGDGGALPRMRRMASELGIAEHVTFTGRVPDRQLLDMLNTADVCVNPDPATDMNDKSTMNKIMEYMALAKPIVQFDLVEGRVSAQQASLYARKNDPLDFARKIVELLDDPERRARMGAFGRQRVLDELEWRHEAPKLLAAYERLFQARARAPAPPSKPHREESK